MKILIGNTAYGFNVVQIDAAALTSNNDEYQIEFRFKRLRSSSQSPEFEDQRSIRCSRDDRNSIASVKSFVTDALQEFSVPENTCSDMTTHFGFCFDSLLRRNRSGSIKVMVSLDVKEISARQAEIIERRRRERVERERDGRAVAAAAAEMEVAPPMPAKRSVVEGLREVVVVDEENDCCSVCLEKFGGGKGIELPCLHVFHSGCIMTWLGRNHFCPLCRFRLPC